MYDENGVPGLTEESQAAIANNDPYWLLGEGNGGHGYRFWDMGAYNPATLHTDGYPLNLVMKKDVSAATQRMRQLKVCKDYDTDYFALAYDAVEKDYRNDLGEPISACITSTSTEDMRVIQACESILEAGIATMVMSESDEEYEANKAEIMAEIRALGEEEVFQRYKAEWDQVKDIMNATHIEASKANGIELYPGLE